MSNLPLRLRQGLLRMKEGAAGVADRVPIYAQVCHHAARLANESTRVFYTDAETFLRCELAADDFYSLDAPTIHYDVYNIEAEALGANPIWREGEAPTIDHSHPLLTSIEAFNQLRPPTMGAAGRMPYVLQINDRLADIGLTPIWRADSTRRRRRSYLSLTWRIISG